jgi:hypothetical protein
MILYLGGIVMDAKVESNMFTSGLEGVVPIDFTAELCRERGWNGSYDWNLVNGSNCNMEGVIINDGILQDYFDATEGLHNKVQNSFHELYVKVVVDPDKGITGDLTEVEWVKRLGGVKDDSEYLMSEADMNSIINNARDKVGVNDIGADLYGGSWNFDGNGLGDKDEGKD